MMGYDAPRPLRRASPANCASLVRVPLRFAKGTGPRASQPLWIPAYAGMTNEGRNDEWGRWNDVGFAGVLLGLGAYFNADGWLGMCFGV